MVHAVGMTQPAVSALPEQSVHFGKASTRQDLSIFPGYAQDTVNTSQVEGVDSYLLSGIYVALLPCAMVAICCLDGSKSCAPNEDGGTAPCWLEAAQLETGSSCI